MLGISNPIGSSTSKPTLILSYVFWKNKYYQEERINWFCETVLGIDPDILLLHNVNNDIISKLLKTFEKYECKVSDATKPFYEMICTKYPVTSTMYKKYSNSTSNGLFCVNIKNDLNSNNLNLFISTLNISSKKYSQAECSLKFASSFPEEDSLKTSFIYSCHTNIIAGDKDPFLPRGIKDVFGSLPSNTLSPKNPLTDEKFRDELGPPPCRPNRMYVSTDLQVENYMLFGNIIFNIDKKLSGSNLYGLLCKIS